MTQLDLARIQGIGIRGYRLPVAGYLFLRIDDVAEAASWLSEATAEVLTAAPWATKPQSGVNIAVTYSGLSVLGVPDDSLAAFPEEFRQGMAARAQILGDAGDSAPENWDGPLGTPAVHMLVMISAQDRAALEAHDQRLRGGLRGLTVIHDQVGVALPGNKEHFGFTDGFAQPSIEGSGVPSLPGQGAVVKGGGWRPIKAGEFILGYEDEEGIVPTAAPPDELSVNGSFLVYRKLYQDVAAFRRQLTAAARLYPGGEEMLAAKLVGRWHDGTPVELSPERPDPAIVADEHRNNAFAYGTDGDGVRCPVGAHVRRANPRDSLPFDGALVNRHRLIRRGVPYGDPLPPGAADDGQDRGVIFVTLQASIQRQFEFVQSQWMNDGNALRLADDQDAVVGVQDGTSPTKMTIPGTPPFFMGPLSRMVTARGGEYFFMPGINGLQFLAAAAGGGAA